MEEEVAEEDWRSCRQKVRIDLVMVDSKKKIVIEIETETQKEIKERKKGDIQ